MVYILSQLTIPMPGTEIIAAAIGSAGVVGAALVSYLANRKNKMKLEQMKNEMDLSRVAMDFAAFLEDWHDTVKEIEKLFEETNIDRFMILRAWNGFMSPKWTTAVYQIRKVSEKNQPVSYVHFELDPDYSQRLVDITRQRYKLYHTDDMPKSAIKSVYENEEVTSAFWAHLDTKKISANSSAITYCSFATHKGTIDEKTATRCKIIAGRLKGVAGEFYNKI